MLYYLKRKNENIALIDFTPDFVNRSRGCSADFALAKETDKIINSKILSLVFILKIILSPLNPPRGT